MQALVKVAAIKNIPFIFIDDSSVQLWALRKNHVTYKKNLKTVKGLFHRFIRWKCHILSVRLNFCSCFMSFLH